MANTTWNIWNDNDGEREAPREKSPLLRTILTVLLVLVVVLGAVTMVSYRDGTGFDVLRRYLNYGRAEKASGETLYVYDASSENRFALLEDYLVVLSETKLRILDANGGEVWSEGVKMDAPMLVSGGDYVAAYDVGGTELYVLDSLGELMTLEMNEEEPILSARLNNNGLLAVTSKKSGYKCGVRVYNDQMQEVYAFNSSQRFLSDAYVTDDNKALAAVTLGQKNSVFVSNVVLYDLKKAGHDPEHLTEYSIEDGLLLEFGQQGDRLMAVTDTGVSFADTNGDNRVFYAYGEDYLRDYAPYGEDFSVLLLNRYRSGSVGRLVTVAADGTQIASLDVNSEVLSVSASGRYIAVLYADRLVVYNRDLQVYASLRGTDYAREALMRPDGSVLLVSAESAELFLP